MKKFKLNITFLIFFLTFTDNRARQKKTTETTRSTKKNKKKQKQFHSFLECSQISKRKTKNKMYNEYYCNYLIKTLERKKYAHKGRLKYRKRNPKGGKTNNYIETTGNYITIKNK